MGTWLLRLAIAALTAFAVWELWRNPGLFTVAMVVYCLGLIVWTEWSQRRVRARARERAWALAATSDDPLRSMAVSMFLQSRTLKEIVQIAEWRAQRKPLDDPAAPPSVQQYHVVLTHEPPREP